MSQTTEFYLTIARKWMLDAKGSVVVLPEELCTTLVNAWKNDRQEFEAVLDKLDMELTVTPEKARTSDDSLLTMSLSFYPSMECFGPRTASIYVSPSLLAGAQQRGQARKEILKVSMFSRLARWFGR